MRTRHFRSDDQKTVPGYTGKVTGQLRLFFFLFYNIPPANCRIWIRRKEKGGRVHDPDPRLAMRKFHRLTQKQAVRLLWIAVVTLLSQVALCILYNVPFAGTKGLFKILLVAFCFISTASATVILCEMISICRRKMHKCTQCGCIYDQDLARCPECGLLQSASFSSDEERENRLREFEEEALEQSCPKDLASSFDDEASSDGDVTDSVDAILAAARRQSDQQMENF